MKWRATSAIPPVPFACSVTHFRRDPDPRFFISPSPGPREQPKKSKARDLVIALRKQNHSVYEIAAALKERALPLSPTAVREVLRAEGFAPLPRRLDEERPAQPGADGGAGGRRARLCAGPGHPVRHPRAAVCFCSCPIWCASRSRPWRRRRNCRARK